MEGNGGGGEGDGTRVRDSSCEPGERNPPRTAGVVCLDTDCAATSKGLGDTERRLLFGCVLAWATSSSGSSRVDVLGLVFVFVVPISQGRVRAIIVHVVSRDDGWPSNTLIGCYRMRVSCIISAARG